MIKYENLKLGRLYVGTANRTHTTEPTGSVCYVYVKPDSYNLGILRDDYSNEGLMCMFLPKDLKMTATNEEIIDRYKKKKELTSSQKRYIELYWRGGMYARRFDFIKELDSKGKITNIEVL